MPIGFEFRNRVALIDFRGKVTQLVGDLSESRSQAIDFTETLNELAVALLAAVGKGLTFAGGELFDAIKQAGSCFMLLTNLSG